MEELRIGSQESGKERGGAFPAILVPVIVPSVFICG